MRLPRWASNKVASDLMNTGAIFNPEKAFDWRLMKRSAHYAVLVALSFFGLEHRTVAAAQGRGATTPEIFDRQIRPLFREYCLRCHSTEKQKGDLDLERYSSAAEVLRHTKVWQMVA